MNAGNLRHRITLEKPKRTINDVGESIIEKWETVTDTWAEVRPLRAWEVERARTIQMSISHRVSLRYMAALSPDWRINWSGVILNISGIVNVDGRNTELELTCEQQQ